MQNNYGHYGNCVPGYACDGLTSKCMQMTSLDTGAKTNNYALCKSMYLNPSQLCDDPPTLQHPFQACNGTQYPAKDCVTNQPGVYGFCMCSNMPTDNSHVCTNMQPGFFSKPDIVAARMQVAECAFKEGCHAPQVPTQDTCIAKACPQQLNALYCAFDKLLAELIKHRSSSPYSTARCIDPELNRFPCRT
eukprot:TRINITY_DN21257_c0_g1_i2.p2 TRINITY_DN21257_c0_g1~~TRINITY_DN21257_c0_g1_i2.p2  ORF type:complete len:190 (+),score=75.33 TRINITY_DN21257_c0_g1_i2:623-1192(+)